MTLNVLIGNGSWYPATGGSAPVITSPTSLPVGTANTAYTNTQFSASGTSPITWSNTGSLPSGMTFSSSGLLSGTPTATANSSITFTATNSYGFADRPLTLTVGAAGAYPEITTGQITSASVNTPYTFSITATGSPTVYAIVDSGTVVGKLPYDGATFNAIKATSQGSGYSNATTATFSSPPPGGIIAQGYPDIVGGQIRWINITDPGSGYTSPPTITLSNTGGGGGAVFETVKLGSVLGGNIPAGISINRSTGVISGTPTAMGYYQFGVIACNSVGAWLGLWGFNVDVVPPYIIEDDLFFAVVGDSFSQTLTTTGAPVTSWSSSGTLPAGLSFNTSTGTISGTASAPSTTTLTVTATNAGGSSTKSFYVTAYAKQSTRLSASDLAYIGSFRLPDSIYLDYAGSAGRSSGMSISNKSGSFGNGTLYLAGRDSTGQTLPVCEINIPNLKDGYSFGISDLNRATIAQNWMNAFEGSPSPISPNGPEICAIAWYENKLYISAGYFYDQNGNEYKTFSRSDVLTVNGSVVGPAGITDGTVSSFRYYMGYLALIPTQVQTAYSIPPLLIGGYVGSLAALGGTGPTGVAFDPANLTGTTTVTGTKVLNYPFINGTDYSKSVTYLFGSPSIPNFTSNQDQNKWFNTFAGTQYSGSAWVYSTNRRVLLIFGRNGIGKAWYGFYQRNQSGATTGGAFDAGDQKLNTTPGLVYDPNSNKGGHGYPYGVYVTAYDESEIAQVITGAKSSWLAKPYDSWVLNYPFKDVNGMNFSQGVAFDSANRKIYVSVYGQDGVRPLVHVYQYTA